MMAKEIFQQTKAKKDSAERTNKYRKELFELCQDAAIGSSRLIALDDVIHIYESSLFLENTRQQMEKQDRDDRRDNFELLSDLAAAKTQQAQIRREIDYHASSVEGYRNAYLKIKGIAGNLEQLSGIGSLDQSIVFANVNMELTSVRTKIRQSDTAH